MIALLAIVLMALAAADTPPPTDPNAAPPRPRLGFKVFKDMDRPLAGLWDLEMPAGRPRRIELKELVPGNTAALVGVDPENGLELMRLERRIEGIGYHGQMMRVFSDCGLEVLGISEFLPLGEAIVIRFETLLPEGACPPLDGGEAGKLRIFSPGGATVRLRDLSEISGPAVREAYGIGGERQTTSTNYYSLTGVSLEPGSEVRFLQRVRTPLDRSLWFEVEAIMAAESGITPPRGFVKGDALRLSGSLALKRAR